MSIQTILSDPVMDIFSIREWGELISPFQRSRPWAGESRLAGTFKEILLKCTVRPQRVPRGCTLASSLLV